MTVKEHLAELERQHKALEQEIAEALAHSSTDYLKIAELKRRNVRKGGGSSTFFGRATRWWYVGWIASDADQQNGGRAASPPGAW
jgi:hypothetical protein